MAKYAQNGLRMHFLQSRISKFSVPPAYQRGEKKPSQALPHLVRASGAQLSPYFINWDSYFSSFWEPCTGVFIRFGAPKVDIPFQHFLNVLHPWWALLLNIDSVLLSLQNLVHFIPNWKNWNNYNIVISWLLLAQKYQYSDQRIKCSSGHDHMVVGFITTYAISAYHH